MATAALKSELERLRAVAAQVPEPAREPGLPRRRATPPRSARTDPGPAPEGGALPRGLRAIAAGGRRPHRRAVHRLRGEAAQVPPDELTFSGLNVLYQRDPDCAVRRWRKVRQATREERRSGHHGARLVEGYCGRSWERAQFLALRPGWSRRGGRGTPRTRCSSTNSRSSRRRWSAGRYAGELHLPLGQERAEPKRGRAGPPPPVDRRGGGSGGGNCGRMHRLCLLTMKALQDGGGPRRPVIVRRAGQVNVGDQQVNVCGGGGSLSGTDKAELRRRKRGIRSEVTEMGWDGGTALPRSRKVNGRVVREYVGGGEVGRLAAQTSAIDQKQRKIERDAMRAERARSDSIDSPVNDLNEIAELLACAALAAAGFRQHKRGEWRKRRGRRDET